MVPWADVYRNTKVLINALSKPENAIIFENICLTQRAPEKLRAILCRCCSWQKTARPKFPAIIRDLTVISDVDLQNINQGKEKSLSPDSSNVRPLTSTKRTPNKTSSSSKTDHQDSDDIVTTQTQFKHINLNPKRKSSTKHRTDDSEDQSTNDDSTRYDAVHDRYLHKGPRGGWYYIGPNDKKIYIKNDST
jgi:hypothetical protein